MIKRRKVKLNKTFFDTVVFSLTLIATSGLMLGLKTAFATDEELFAYMFSQNTLIDKQPMAINGIFTYDEENFLGIIKVEINNGRVRVIEQTSPTNDCELQGYVSTVATPILCLPNQFYIEIRGIDFMDFPSKAVDSGVQDA